MAARRTNLALLVLLLVAFTTGGFAYGLGTEWNRWAVIAHAIAGIGIVLLAPWKSVIARRGLRSKKRGHTASVALAFLAVVALVFGLLHSTGLAKSLGALTAMQLHVGAALVAVPFALWHVVTRRVRVHRTDVSRRQLLKAGGVVGGAGILYVATERLVHVTGAPGSDRRYTGSYERGSGRPHEMPVTQWLTDSVPAIDASNWRLRLRAPRSSDVVMAYDDLDSYDERVVATLDCTGGWWARQEWTGVSLARLCTDAGFRIERASSIEVGSATGYVRRFPATDASTLLLATRAAGRPLSPGHGFPVRIVAPGRRGFWWVKWVVDVELSDKPWWLQAPFPLS
jgi:Oxidoreductase molybdopterin binding domain